MPSIQNIMKQLEHAQVCTNTQCFETVDDLVTLHTPESTNATTHAYALLTFALLILALFKPAHHPKHANISSSSNDPPPPLT